MTTKQQLAEEFDAQFHFLVDNNDYHREEQIKFFLDQAYDRIREESLREAEACVPKKLPFPGQADVVWLGGWNKARKDTLEAIHSLITKK